jgi:hypothetical protein
MTSVGKILAFFNLVFSVAAFALIAIVFSTRANWKAEYEKMKNTALVLEAALKESEFRHKNELRSKEEQVNALTADVSNLGNQLTQARADKTTAENQLAQASKEKNQAVSNQQAAEAELKQVQKEREVLGKEKLEREKTIVDLTKEVNKARQAAVQSDNDKKTALFQAERLLVQLEDVSRKLNDERQKGTTGSILTPTAPPPPKDVRGTVTGVSDNGLTMISIGSNQGLTVGNNLEVFRIDPKDPKASQYLGQLSIKKVTASEAVGQFTPVGRIKLPKIGDEVAASISGR